MSEQAATGVPKPTIGGIRTQIGRFAELWLGGMFLQPQAYAYERDGKNPLGNGLLYIAIIGVIIALTHLIGAGLRFATSPSGDAIKNTVLAHLQAMPFYAAFDSARMTQFDRGYDQAWDRFGYLFLGYPMNEAGFVTPVLGVLVIPLSMAVVWIVYGALVHLVAHRWNRETSFGELLAPLALAASPQLLYVVGMFPGAGAGAVVVSLWTFICNIFAIRIAYQTTTRRAVWGAVFPILLLVLLILLLVLLPLGFLMRASVPGSPQ